jgi:hypothetical protein
MASKRELGGAGRYYFLRPFVGLELALGPACSFSGLATPVS